MARFRLIVAAAASLGFMAGAQAQELKIGLSAEPSAMDPHFHNLTPNHSATKHIFDRLLDQDENQRIQPMLALSWKNVDDTTWEFKLRPGVKFTDGGDLTANDVIYSIAAPAGGEFPSSMALNVRAITDMKAPDPLTLVIKTTDAHPVLPAELATVAIISAKANGAGEVTFDRAECKGVGTIPRPRRSTPARRDRLRPLQTVRFTKGRPRRAGAQ